MSQETMHTSSLVSKDAFQDCERICEKVGSAMVWSEAKLPAGDQLIVDQVVLKLLVDHSFHHLANDTQQGNWPVLS